MSNASTDKQAWVWYDIASLQIRHVGFNDAIDYGVGLASLPIPYELAVDIVSGKSRLGEFDIINQDNAISFRMRKMQLSKKPKFWQLIDPEKPRTESSFGSSDDQQMPVRIYDKTMKSFMVDVISNAKNIQFYITMRNDPNYLIKTIDLYPNAVDNGSTTGIKISVNLKRDYSIYVRYDAT